MTLTLPTAGKKKVCLIGSAPSSVRLAPYGDPNWDIWACSPGVYGVAPRTTVYWELHRYEPGQPWFSPEYCQFLARHPAVIMSEKRAEIPNSIELPVNDLVSKYGPYWFTSSLSWMFAMALELGYEKIALFGVDMAATDEYALQRPALWFFGTLARMRGVEVGVPPESDLFSPPPLYGPCELSHSYIKMTARSRELNQRLQMAQQQMETATRDYSFLRGAVDDLNWHVSTWHGNTEMLGRNYVAPPIVPAMQLIAEAPKQIEIVAAKKPAKKSKPNGQLEDRLA